MISYIIEGPKGSGKSTLSNLIQNQFGGEIKHYNGDNYLTTEKLINDKQSDKLFIHDRGFLSYFVYGFVSNIKQDNDFEISTIGSQLNIKVWAPLTQNDFTDWIDSCDNKLIILYASDDKLLFDRIKKRESEIGKGATKKELSFIKNSNQLFYTMGQMFKFLRPEKVELLDICDDNFNQYINNLDG